MVLIVERQSATHHLIHDHTETPPVHRTAVIIVLQHLRTNTHTNIPAWKHSCSTQEIPKYVQKQAHRWTPKCVGTLYTEIKENLIIKCLVLTCLTFNHYCINTQKPCVLQFQNWRIEWMWIWIELDTPHRKLNWNVNDRKRHLMPCHFTKKNSKIHLSISIHPWIQPSIHPTVCLSIHS